MEKLYNTIKTDIGMIATPSYCDFLYIKKFYPEMIVIDLKITKEQIKEKYSKKIKFVRMDEL